MGCKETRARLGAWMDGALSGREAQGVGDHLDGCAGCRAELSRLRALSSALEAWQAPLPPKGLEQRILLAARRPDLRGRSFLATLGQAWSGVAWPLRVAAASAAAALVMAGAWLGSDMAEPQPVQLVMEDHLLPGDPFHLIPGDSPLARLIPPEE